jgi:hypothetical protein
VSARGAAALAGLCGALALGPACRAPAAGSAVFPAGREIVVCGERVPVDAPVVLWTDEPFYDAYREGPRFADSGAGGRRYRPGREAAGEGVQALSEHGGWTRALLAEQVDLLVLHYDACGTSRECFRVLQDERELSVHFLLDLDGTLYQTLDLREQAWHARAANARSIGVEIAQVGAFPPGERERLARWYEWSEQGTRIRIPAALGDGGLRTRAFTARPARRELVRGEIHGAPFVQHDFTPEQYESLAALAAALARVFPRIELEAPRDLAGRVRTDALSDEEEAAFRGVVGHYHLQTDKRDPGPAFDWEGVLERARARSVEP